MSADFSIEGNSAPIVMPRSLRTFIFLMLQLSNRSHIASVVAIVSSKSIPFVPKFKDVIDNCAELIIIADCLSDKQHLNKSNCVADEFTKIT